MIRYAALVVALTCITTAQAENWPSWRGRTGQGHSSEKNLPTEWSETKNVRWKIALDHQAKGSGTPVSKAIPIRLEHR